MSDPFSPLPIGLWPQVDADRWAKAKVGGKLFDKGGAADWRSATVAKTHWSYAVYLGWLWHRDMLDPMQTMEQRISPELTESFVVEYQIGRAPLTVASAVRGVAQMMRACNPPDGLEWLSKLAWVMMNNAKPVRPKLPRIASPDELLQLADMLMQDGRGTYDAGEQGRLKYRNGLIIACLTVRPMRLSEFMALRLGTTLVRHEKGWLIDIPPGITKKGRRRRQFFPKFLTAAIDYYVEYVRADLPSQPLAIDSGSLWLGRDGPLRPISLSNIVGNVTLVGLGKRISPHIFRDCAATAIALEIPKQVGITKSVLGHATLNSSQRYYNQAKGFSASAELADVISKMRSGT